MVPGSETKHKMRDMGADELLHALERQDDDECAGLSFAERLRAAVDDAHSAFVTAKAENLARRAYLRYPQADVRCLELAEERGLDRVKIAELASCGYAERGTNVIIEGFTGSGKSWMACALANAACRRRIRASCIRMPDLEEQWRAASDRPSGVSKLLRKLSNYTALVLDEWLLDIPGKEFRSFIFELAERRYGTVSTIFCTQHRKQEWHARPETSRVVRQLMVAERVSSVRPDAIITRLLNCQICFLLFGQFYGRIAVSHKNSI